jgi:hypothetical protein
VYRQHVESSSAPAVERVPFPADPPALAAGDGSTRMTLGPREHTSTTDGRSRLRMRSAPAAAGAAEGAWWPRATGLVDQLPAVLVELWERLGGIERVIYNPLVWPDTAPRIAVRGRLVHLVASRTQDPDSLDLISATNRRATTLLVVPIGSSPEVAEAALAAAAMSGSTGIVSRFIGAGVARVPEQGRPGHETGESFRARAAEELHTAGQRANAVRTVAGHALDAEDCEMLLSLLGLDALDGSRAADVELGN